MLQAILTNLNCDLLCQESSLLVCIAVVLVWIVSGCLWNVGLCFQNPPRYDNHFSHFLKLYTNLSHLYPGRTAPLFVEGLKNPLCSRSVNCSSKWKPVPTNSLFISPACFFRPIWLIFIYFCVCLTFFHLHPKHSFSCWINVVKQCATSTNASNMIPCSLALYLLSKLSTKSSSSFTLLNNSWMLFCTVNEEDCMPTQ